MSTEREHALRRRGEQLAAELQRFLEQELEEPEDRAQALLGAFDYLDRHTGALRDAGPAWPGAAKRKPDQENRN